MDRPSPPRDGSPPAKRARSAGVPRDDDAAAASTQPTTGDPGEWRAAMTATLAALMAQAQAGQEAMQALQVQVASQQATTEALRAQVATQGAAMLVLSDKAAAQAEATATHHSRTTTRLDLIRAAIDAGQYAQGVVYGERLRLAAREKLSDAEEVLSIPYLSERSILSYLWQDEALELRAASRACRQAVAEHAWSDCDLEGGRSKIHGSVASWRACFPKARAACIFDRSDIVDADFVHFRGINTLDMTCCGITDAAFAHLPGIRTLDMRGCNQATITDAAFAHLRGIHTLNMSWCDQDTITDAAFAHLRGIHALDMSHCRQATITDAAFAHLRGIHTLDMSGCFQDTITDAAFAHLRGIQTLDMTGCSQDNITDAAFAHLRGIHTLDHELLLPDHRCRPGTPARHPRAAHQRLPTAHECGTGAAEGRKDLSVTEPPCLLSPPPLQGSSGSPPSGRGALERSHGV